MTHAMPLVQAKSLVETQRFAEALAVLRTYVAAHPEDHVGWRQLALACLGADLLDEALSAAERAVALAPGDGRSHRTRATVLTFAGRERQAMTSIMEAVRLMPTDAESHAVHAGLLLLRRDRVAAGEAAAKRAYDLDPSNVTARSVYTRLVRSRITAALLLAKAVFAATALTLLLFGVALLGERGSEWMWAFCGLAALAALLIPNITPRLGQSFPNVSHTLRLHSRRDVRRVVIASAVAGGASVAAIAVGLAEVPWGLPSAAALTAATLATLLIYRTRLLPSHASASGA